MWEKYGYPEIVPGCDHSKKKREESDESEEMDEIEESEEREMSDE